MLSKGLGVEEEMASWTSEWGVGGSRGSAPCWVLGQGGSLWSLIPVLLSRAAEQGRGAAPVLPQLQHGGRGAVEHCRALSPPVQPQRAKATCH